MKLETSQIIEVFDLILDENEFKPYQRRKLKEKVRKAAKKGKLKELGLGPEWAWRICAANLVLGRLNHWWGWETRSQIIWDLCNHPWHYPRWDGSQCDLYLVGEQGIGDEILFSNAYRKLLQFIPTVTIECDSRLIPAFKRTFSAKFESRWKQDIERPSTEADSVPLRQHRGPHDMFMPAGNALKTVVKKPEDFEQNWIEMDLAKTRKWKDWLAPLKRPWVGVSWVGRQGTLDPSIFEGGTIFNLNYEGTLGFNPDPTDTFDDQWHFISALDRVDTVTNSLVHMAGAVGTPCNAIKAPPMYGDTNNRLQWHFGELAKHFYPLMTVHQSEEDYAKAQKDMGDTRTGSRQARAESSEQDPDQ